MEDSLGALTEKEVPQEIQMNLNTFHKNRGWKLGVACTQWTVNVQEVEKLVHFLLEEEAAHDIHR